MLQQVDVGQQSVGSYAASAGEEVVAQLRELAAGLRGARVLHLSATPYGGGVAEILRSEIPLLRDLGLDADWQLITGDEAFLGVTTRSPWRSPRSATGAGPAGSGAATSTRPSRTRTSGTSSAR